MECAPAAGSADQDRRATRSQRAQHAAPGPGPAAEQQGAGLGQKTAVTAAAPAALQASAPLPSSGSSAMTSTATETILALLDKLSSIDRDGYFRYPVDEVLHHAPGYYKVIKQPMCFSEMRQRLANGVYVSFKGFKEDFELICANAKVYNRPTTKVFKAAGVLSQKGSKILDQHEMDFRKAFAVLEQQRQASAGAAASGRQQPQNDHPPSTSGEGVPGGFGFTVRTRMGDPQQQGAAGTSQPEGGDLNSTMPPPPPFHATHRQPSSSMPPPPPLLVQGPAPHARPLRMLSQYVSDDDEDGGRATAAGGGAAAAASTSGRDSGEPLDAVLRRIREGVRYQRWDALEQQQDQGPPSSSQPQQQQQQQQQQPGGAPSTSWASSGEMGHGSVTRTAEWREQRRPSEWQCRWLELRLRELASQRRRLQRQLTIAAAQQGGTGQAEGGPQQQQGQQQQPAQPVQQQRHEQAQGQGSGQAMGQAAGRVRACAFFQQRAGGASALGSASAMDIGDADASAAVPGPSEHLADRPDATASLACADAAPVASTSATPPALPLAAAPTDARQIPALVHTACELLSQRLLELRNQITEAFPGLGTDAAATAGQAQGGFAAVAGQAAGGGRGGRGGQGGMRRVSSGRQPSAHAYGDAHDGKRRRSDAEVLDGLGSPLLRSNTLDRTPTAIFIPPVRDLPDAEQQARRVAATTWNAAYRLQGKSALSTVPAEVQAILAPADEGSSSEDTGDELYARLHKMQEQLEQRKYAAAGAAESSRKRANKAPGKGHAHAAAQSMKTPRSHPAVGGAGGAAAAVVALPGHHLQHAPSLLQSQRGLHHPQPVHGQAQGRTTRAAAGAHHPPPLPTEGEEGPSSYRPLNGRRSSELGSVAQHQAGKAGSGLPTAVGTATGVPGPGNGWVTGVGGAEAAAAAAAAAAGARAGRAAARRVSGGVGRSGRRGSSGDEEDEVDLMEDYEHGGDSSDGSEGAGASLLPSSSLRGSGSGSGSEGRPRGPGTSTRHHHHPSSRAHHHAAAVHSLARGPPVPMVIPMVPPPTAGAAASTKLPAAVVMLPLSR